MGQCSSLLAFLTLTIIGGGVPMGGLLMVMEDLESPHHLSLLRFFIAQGVVHGQPILYGSSLASPTALLGTLPAVLTTSDRASSAEKNSDVGEALRIAWQYRRYLPEQQALDEKKQKQNQRLSKSNLNEDPRGSSLDFRFEEDYRQIDHDNGCQCPPGFRGDGITHCDGMVHFLTFSNKCRVDDVFVLVNILRNYLKDPKIINSNPIPEEEMRLTVALAGPSVVLTTFSVLAAFFISSVSPMPVVRWFCWQMGITATLHTCGMILIFMPIMAIDARRVKVSICDPYLWLFSGMRKQICSEDVSIEKTKVSSPRKGINFQGHVGSTSLSKFVAKYYSPLFESNTFKIAMVLLFTAFLTGMSYLGFVKVERGSYQNAFAVITEDRFPSYQIYYVTKGIDYPTEQETMLHIYQTLQANLSYWMPPQPRILEASPLENLILFASLEGLSLLSVNVSGQQLSVLPSNIFYKVRQEWSSTPLDIDECKEHLACQCKECSCKNNWGGFDCRCNGDLIYIREHDTCISKIAAVSRVGWTVIVVLFAGLALVGIVGYMVYKYRLRSYMDSEIRAIMAQYMPLDSQGDIHQHLHEDSL